MNSNFPFSPRNLFFMVQALCVVATGRQWHDDFSMWEHKGKLGARQHHTCKVHTTPALQAQVYRMLKNPSPRSRAVSVIEKLTMQVAEQPSLIHMSIHEMTNNDVRN